MRTMWRCWLLCNLLATRTQAFEPAPILWRGAPASTYALVPKVLSWGSALNKGFVPPQDLVIQNQLGRTLTSEFTVKPDKTIAWNANWCVEATGGSGESAMAVRINRCTGLPAQQWDVSPQGHRGDMHIQLAGTSMCIGVNANKGGLNGAHVELQECDDSATEAWAYQERILDPTRGASLKTSIVLAILPALAVVAWLWRRQLKASTIVPRQGAIGLLWSADEGGISLTKTPGCSPRAHRMVPAVMTITPMNFFDGSLRKSAEPGDAKILEGFRTTSTETLNESDAYQTMEGWPLQPTYSEQLEYRLSQYARELGQFDSLSPKALKKAMDPANMAVRKKILDEAYKECERITNVFSKTFSAGTNLMTSDQKKAITAIYVWCRRTDDLVDNPRNAQNLEAMTADLESWRSRLYKLWTNDEVDDILDLALLDARQNYPSLPIKPFLDMIEGMMMDTPQFGQSRYGNFEELYLYCYRVAGTVGLMTLPILGGSPGFSDKDRQARAVALGVALQLTNILRDVGEDAQRGRIYLPQEDLAKFGVTEKQIFDGVVDSNYVDLIRFQMERTRRFYRQAEEGIPMLAPGSRLAIEASGKMYAGILQKIEANDYNNLTKRAFVSKPEKLTKLLECWWSVIWMK